MLENQGNLWTYSANWRVITTNGIVNSGGEAVMGKGVALQAKKLYPHLPAKLGLFLSLYGNRPFIFQQEGLLTFPTKEHWRDLSSIQLIVKSAKAIVKIADKYNLEKIVMSRPGCGNGGLTWDFVKPWIQDILDERFTVLCVE